MKTFGEKFVQQMKLLLFIVFFGASALNVTIISLLPYSIDVRVNLRWTGPALIAAVDDTNLLFEPRYHAVLKLIFNESHKSCDESKEDISRLLAEYYYGRKLEGSCVALVGALCTDIKSVADLAREWNVLAFAMGPVSEEVVTNDLAFVMGGSSLGMAIATWGVMEHYAWKHATILLDANSFTNLYSQFAETLLRASRRNRISGISLSLISIKQITEANLVKSLKTAQLQSRVMIISAPAATALRMLRIASRLNMTNGNYAFINFQNTLQEPYGKLSDFANPSPTDLPAVQSLIFLTPRQNELEAQRSKPLNDRLKALSRDLYNATYDEDSQPLDAVVVRATYDSVDFFMRLLNTSMDTDGKFTCSGRNLALKATNRTFSLRTGVSFIDENGVRQLDTAVYRFSLTTNSMQVVGFFDLSSRLLLWDSNVTADWPNGIIPVDMPPCGFAGLSEACTPTNHSWVDDLKVAFPIVASFAVLLLMTSVWYRHNHSRSKHETESWILDPALLRSYQTETSSVKTTVNVTVSLIGLLKKEFNFG